MKFAVFILLAEGWEKLYEGTDPFQAIIDAPAYSVMMVSSWTETQGWVSRYYSRTSKDQPEQAT